MGSGTLQMFFSYAHEDVDIVVNLQKHLTPLRHERIVEFWYDRDLLAGQSWDLEISGSTRLSGESGFGCEAVMAGAAT